MLKLIGMKTATLCGSITGLETPWILLAIMSTLLIMLTSLNHYIRVLLPTKWSNTSSTLANYILALSCGGSVYNYSDWPTVPLRCKVWRKCVSRVKGERFSSHDTWHKRCQSHKLYTEFICTRDTRWRLCHVSQDEYLPCLLTALRVVQRSCVYYSCGEKEEGLESRLRHLAFLWCHCLHGIIVHGIPAIGR